MIFIVLWILCLWWHFNSRLTHIEDRVWEHIEKNTDNIKKESHEHTL